MSKAYFVGGGLGTLAAAADCLRKRGMRGGDLFVYETAGDGRMLRLQGMDGPRPSDEGETLPERLDGLCAGAQTAPCVWKTLRDGELRAAAPEGEAPALWEWLLSQSSLVRPLRAFLVDSDVHFIRQTVTDLEFEEGEETAVTALYTTDGRREEMVQLHEGDLCFFSPGQGDCAAWADAARLPGSASACPDVAVLWRRIAARRPGLGNPEAFFTMPETTERALLLVHGLRISCGQLERLAAADAIVKLEGTPWEMSMRVQGARGARSICACCLRPGARGALTGKPMRACSGLEAARELLGAIGEGMSLPNREADVFFGILPYAGAPLLAGTEAARPCMLPVQSENLAVLGPFVSGSFSPVRTLLDARRAVEALSRPLPAAAGRDFFRRSPSAFADE